MRFLSAIAVLFSVNVFATQGMPKQARFVLSPAELETVITIEELDLSAFQVIKCLDLLDVKTGVKTTSMSIALSYSGPKHVITIGKQAYQLAQDFHQFVFGTPGCGLDMTNLQSIQLRFQNTHLSESHLTMLFEFHPKEYKDVASLLFGNLAYRGKVLAYY